MIAKNIRAVATAFVLGTAALAAATMPADAAVRAAVGKPLQEAQSLTASGNYSAALAKIRQAESVGGLTAEESKIVKQMKDYVTIKAGGSGGPVESGPAAQAKFNADWNARRYRDVIADEDLLRKFNALTGTYQIVVAQAYEQLGDYRGCVHYADSHSAGAEMLKLGASCAFKAGDDKLALDMALKLVSISPSPENWDQLLRQAERAKQLSDPQTLDIYRLKLLTGNMKGADDYFTLAQMLIAGRVASEAAGVIDRGVQAKLLVDQRAQRLIGMAKKGQADEVAGIGKSLAAAQKAPRGDDLIKVGEELTGMGRYGDAVGALQAAIAKGVADTDNAQVRLAVALYGNKQKPAALSALERTKTPNGTMVAKMWAAYIRGH